MPAGASATLAVRPEQLVVGDAGAGLWPLGEAVVAEAMFLGAYWRVQADSAASGRRLMLHLPPTRMPRPGERLSIAVPPASLALLRD